MAAGPSNAAASAGSPKMPAPTMVLNEEKPSPATPITRSSGALSAPVAPLPTHHVAIDSNTVMMSA